LSSDLNLNMERVMEKPLKLIAVDGPIGSGKTTLVKMLAEDFRGNAVFEPVQNNPFLPEFYKDRKRNAFKTQVYFLLNRYQQQCEIKKHENSDSLVICDYTFLKDAIFAEINLSDDERKLYQTIFNLLKANLPTPDIVIYLRADSKVLSQRIKKRGIDYERSINEAYLSALTDAYDSFFLNYKETPLLVVDTSSVNYPDNPEDYENLKREILNHRGGTVHLIAR